MEGKKKIDDFTICSQLQPNSVKNRYHGHIKDNNIEELRVMTRNFEVDPQEELSKAGFLWNAFHYACHFDRPEILEYLIQVAYRKHPQNYEKIMQVKTTEKWTPLSIAMIYNKPICLKILFKYGGFSLENKDKDKRTPYDLAKYYNQQAVIDEYGLQLSCSIILKNELGEDYLPPQIKQLEESPSYEELIQIKQEEDLDDIQKMKFRDLLIFGERFPCTICLSDKGYLKYTTCCGQPLHGGCKKQTENCPLCAHNPLRLTDKIIHVERAFYLSENEKVKNQ